MDKIKCIESYHIGFMNGIDAKQNFKYQILGYGIEDIFKAIEFWERNKDNQMTVEYNGTRQQAIKNCCHGIYYTEELIRALEALGLIKFKEEKYLVVDIDEPAKIMIKRNGKTVYKD